MKRLIGMLRNHRRLKRKNLHHDVVLNQLDGLIKRHSTGQICKLKMELRQGHSTGLGSDGSLTNDSFDNIRVLGDQCYCKFHEHGDGNTCAQLLVDPQLTDSVDVKHEITPELEKRMNRKRKTNSKHKHKHTHSSKKRRNKKIMKHKTIFQQAKQNRIEMERNQQAEQEMQQIIKDRTWWLGLKRYVIENCETDEQYKTKCLNHCLKLPLQHYDLIETHHEPVQEITTSDVISQALNQS